jgi:hypothetical protein
VPIPAGTQNVAYPHTLYENTKMKYFKLTFILVFLIICKNKNNNEIDSNPNSINNILNNYFSEINTPEEFLKSKKFKFELNNDAHMIKTILIFKENYFEYHSSYLPQHEETKISGALIGNKINITSKVLYQKIEEGPSYDKWNIDKNYKKIQRIQLFLGYYKNHPSKQKDIVFEYDLKFSKSKTKIPAIYIKGSDISGFYWLNN